MKKNFLTLILFLFTCSLSFTSEIKPLSIVVIGGGPTGLGAAIEAHLMGAEVIVVEKRQAYTRENTLFLYRVTLDLFDKWKVKVRDMEELYLGEERRGFVLIKDLEDSLAKKVDELGIKRLHGEFKDFAKGEQAAVIQTTEGDISLPYDILVGADGAKSRVREKLNISLSNIAQAIAGVSMVSGKNADMKIGLEIGTHKDVFIKKVTIPTANVFLIQNRPGSSIEKLTQQHFASFAYEAGWQQEAELIANDPILTLENVTVNIQRAALFSDQNRAAILLGDAAGCGSFYRGMGANYSLKTAEYAGNFFKTFQQEDAYANFNQNMEIAVDTLIQDSMHLFTN